MLSFLDPIREFTLLAVVCKITLSMLFGGVLGLERGKKRRPAGLRTYMLVCIGATLVMITSQYIMQTYSVGDPQRLGAQVISGIGFLGAGTIIVTGKSQVKGLTTAAGLWAAACMGLAIGIGFYEGAIVSCFLMYLALTIFQRVDSRLYMYSKVIELHVEFASREYVSDFVRHLRTRSIQIVNLEVLDSIAVKEDMVGIRISLDMPSRRHHGEVMASLGELEGVAYIEEVI